MSFIVKGGWVIDPANDRDEVGDVCFTNGTIVSPSDAPDDAEVIDAERHIVTAGLVDLNTHVCEKATALGVNPDETCLPFGVTTVCDAGSTGSSTLAGLRTYVVDEKPQTNVLAMVNIGGEEGGSSCGADVEQCVQTIEKNRDLVVGVRVRLSAEGEDEGDDGKNEKDIYRKALEVSEQMKMPLMAHRMGSTILPMGERDAALGCPGSLRAGDIYTHTYLGNQSSIIDSETGKVHEEVWAAKKRGVLFDVGHGQGSFNWSVAEACAKESFFPDIISTGLSSGNLNKAGRPVYDMPHVMSKLVHLGMRPQDVVRATTATPARALNRSDTIGSLGIGKVADIVMWRENRGEFVAEDCQADTRVLHRVLEPVAVFRRGVRVVLPYVNGSVEA